MDPWIVTQVERARHIEQFKQLGPQGGYVTGDQAKIFLLQSQLPPPVLGQIWGLADVNCDGKMDINEFSVACKLITMKLKGFEVPQALPPGLKSVLLGTGTTTTPIMSPTASIGTGSLRRTSILSGPGTGATATPVLSPTAVIPGNMIRGTSFDALRLQQQSANVGMGLELSQLPEMPTSISMDPWTVTQVERARHIEQFKQLGPQGGYVTGDQARHFLLQSQLPPPILGQIWAMADVNCDGKMDINEFSVACKLITMKLKGFDIPQILPPGLKNVLLGSTTTTPVLSPTTSVGSGTSFEDKRKMNFDKGQAELDRRRRVLEDAANREREERDRKEREEYEKREKARLEQERRKHEEMERQLAIQREMEERRLEEMQKAEEQKEAARKEMERQRKVEMEENKRLELLARRQKEQDEVLRLKGVNHGLGLELSQLTDKVKELSGKITETRVGVSTVKSEIDGMRAKRDGFMTETSTLKAQLKEQNNRMLYAAQEKIRLEKLANESEVKHINLKQLREKLQNMKEELGKKQSDADTAVGELDELKATLSTVIESCKSIYEEYQDKREKVIAMRKKHNAEFDYNVAWGAPVKRAGSLHDTGTPDGLGGAVYYRALYDFDSQNPDELPFGVGAIIQRDDSVNPDPGWLAGTLNGRSGWFPESFVEMISAEEASFALQGSTGITTQASVDSQQYNASGGEYYIALYPYDSSEPGDLPFEAGETIFVTHCEGEWWTGSIGTDRTGIFPANYVAKQSEVATEAVNAADDVLAPINNFTADFPTFESTGSKTELEPYEEAEIKREIGELAKGPPKSPKTVKTKKYEIATVLANYQANGEGQLTLTRGQLITVRKKSNSGWWEGEVQAKGKKRELGWFPGSYVKILGPGGGSRQSSSRTTPIPFDDLIMPTTVAPVYTDSKEQMIALYPYTAQNSDELTFVKDDIITIISKDEPDWWRGQLGTAIGLFPVNYVQPLSQGDEQNNQSLERRISDWSNNVCGDGDYGQEQQGQDYYNDWFEDNFHSYNNGGDSTASHSGSRSLNRTPQFEGSYDKYQYHDETEYHIEAIPFYSKGQSIIQMAQTQCSEEEKARQVFIKEFIESEQNYLYDLKDVEMNFFKNHKLRNVIEIETLRLIFVNWSDLIPCSRNLLKAFSVRSKMSENNVITMVGDIICQHIPTMNIYIRFCSAQRRSSELLQRRLETDADARELVKEIESEMEQKLPFSSYLLKPMQRITRYPLLIKKILQHTPPTHPDRQNLEEALAKAEELCSQVNEGVREFDNSDRLEWMQDRIDCSDLKELLNFNSTTNSVGPRKFLHHGVLKKAKSGKELLGLLFNDFILLAQPIKPLNQTSFSFDRDRKRRFRIYRKPLFLNEIIVDEDGGQTEAEFVLRTDNRTYQLMLVAPSVTEKRLWVKSIIEAQKNYHRVQQQYLLRQKSKKVKAAMGRLLVTVMEATNLHAKTHGVRDIDEIAKYRWEKLNQCLTYLYIRGKTDPYCEVSLGSEIRQTRVVNGTVNPKWNDSMQFSVKDLNEDILCFTVYDKEGFCPDKFLGRTEIAISSIYEQTKDQKMPLTKTFPLLEIESGEITIKLHLQIFEE